MSVTERLASLERRVALLELRAGVLHRESNRRVLDVLANHARNPFNDGTMTLTPNTIRSATGYDAKDLALALHQLQDAAYIELVKTDGTGHWRITEDGLCAYTEREETKE